MLTHIIGAKLLLRGYVAEERCFSGATHYIRYFPKPKAYQACWTKRKNARCLFDDKTEVWHDLNVVAVEPRCIATPQEFSITTVSELMNPRDARTRFNGSNVGFWSHSTVSLFSRVSLIPS